MVYFVPIIRAASDSALNGDDVNSFLYIPQVLEQAQIVAACHLLLRQLSVVTPKPLTSEPVSYNHST